MSVYEKMAQVLTDSLQLKVAPVAVCLTNSPPSDTPARSGTAAAAGCMFWEEGAQRAFSTSGTDHENCTIGMFTHHLPMTTATQEANLNDSLKVFADLGYVRPEDVPLIPVMNREVRHVVYAPLAETPLPPDAVLLFVQAQQALILSEAAQQVEAGMAPALGRPACAIVPQVVNTNRAAMSLGCCGARAYLSVLTDDVALWALPGVKLSAYVERIEALAKANSVLSQFHQIRRKDVAGGGKPTIKESLARMSE
jgi:uncharacterized protein (DUF169 family)